MLTRNPYPEGLRPQKGEYGKALSEIQKWELDSTGARGADGKPLPRRRWLFTGTMRQAVESRKVRLMQLAQGQLPSVRTIQEVEPTPEKPVVLDSATITFRDYYRSRYVPWAKEHLGEDTWPALLKRIELHIIPTLGPMSLADVNDVTGEEAIRTYIRGRTSLKKASAKNQILLCLSGVLTHAATPRNHKGGVPVLTRKHRFLPFKDDVDEGEQLDLSGAIPKGHLRHKRFTQAEAEALLRAARAGIKPVGLHPKWINKPAEWWVVLLGMGLYCGFRPSEVCARKWKDYRNGTLAVHSQISPKTKKYRPRTKNGVTGTPKVPKPFAEALDALKAQLDPPPLDDDYILGPMDAHDLRRRFRDVTLAAFGAKSGHYHRLRHTYGSSLADAGIPVEIIQGLMRHRSVATTYGYIAPDPERVDRASSVLDFEGGKS